MKKNKIISLFLLLTFISQTAFAKQNDIKSKTEVPELNLGKKDNREGLNPFDYNKLMVDAEKYFKEAKAWNILKCQPKNGFICSKHECKKREMKSSIVLNKKAKTIMRCDGDICETFPAQFNQTGVYFNVQTEGPVGTLIRILGDSRYKEITTVALDAYIANGECEVMIEEEKEKK
jgi:hypothetical protein